MHCLSKILQPAALIGLLLASTQCTVDIDMDVNGRQILGDGIPGSFVSVQSVIPEAVIEVRYFGSNNFVGKPIDGYEAPVLYLTESAALMLAEVQAELKGFGLGLKLFDAYRPQPAVDHFVRWGQDLNDTAMKSQYYPGVDKANLFRDGYIAARSGHSRGSTVDLTIVALDTGEGLDMGSPWDFFDPISWPSSTAVTAQQRANRLLLRDLMTQYGFVPLKEEWWHFTLRDEPYSDSYFNFPVTETLGQ